MWNVIADIGWGTKSTDYKEIGGTLAKTLSPDKIHQLENFVKDKRKALVEKLKTMGSGYFEVGDDGFWDLTAHIVGLGEETYNKIMEDPASAKGMKYKENFQYIFHYTKPEDASPSSGAKLEEAYNFSGINVLGKKFRGLWQLNEAREDGTIRNGWAVSIFHNRGILDTPTYDEPKKAIDHAINLTKQEKIDRT